MSGMLAKAIASSVFLSSGAEKISRSGVVRRWTTLAAHFADSGTNSRMKNVSAAGAAPIIITHRHESCRIGNVIPINAIST